MGVGAVETIGGKHLAVTTFFFFFLQLTWCSAESVTSAVLFVKPQRSALPARRLCLVVFQVLPESACVRPTMGSQSQSRGLVSLKASYPFFFCVFFFSLFPSVGREELKSAD